MLTPAPSPPPSAFCLLCTTFGVWTGTLRSSQLSAGVSWQRRQRRQRPRSSGCAPSAPPYALPPSALRPPTFVHFKFELCPWHSSSAESFSQPSWIHPSPGSGPGPHLFCTHAGRKVCLAFRLGFHFLDYSLPLAVQCSFPFFRPLPACLPRFL